MEEDDTRGDEIIQRFGLHPAEERLDEVRAVLAAQARLGWDEHIEVMRICSVMLFNAGHITDSRLWSRSGRRAVPE